jgi:hypothetical protein
LKDIFEAQFNKTMMNQEQRKVFEKYWSSENFLNRLIEADNEELFFEKQRNHKKIALQESEISKLKSELEVAKKEIRQLKGEPEPEPELEPEPEDDLQAVEIERQYCCTDFLNQEYEESELVTQYCKQWDLEDCERYNKLLEENEKRKQEEEEEEEIIQNDFRKLYKNIENSSIEEKKMEISGNKLAWPKGVSFLESSTNIDSYDTNKIYEKFENIYNYNRDTFYLSKIISDISSSEFSDDLNDSYSPV